MGHGVYKHSKNMRNFPASISQNFFHSAVMTGRRDATLPVLALLAMAAATLVPEKCRETYHKVSYI